MHEIPENELPDGPFPSDEQAAGSAPGCAPGDLPLSDEELVSAYLDGELHGPALACAERLLQERPECRQLLEEMRGLRAALAALPRVELERNFYQHVLRRAEHEMLSAPEEAVSQGDPTLSATTLPAITLPLPQPDGPESGRDVRGARTPEVGSQAAQTDHPSAAGQAGPFTSPMPAARGMPPAASMPAGESMPAARPVGQRGSSQQPAHAFSGEEAGSAAQAPQFEQPSGLRARRFLSRAATMLAALAALLLVGLFLKSNWGGGELAQGPAALDSDSKEGLEIGRLEGTKSRPAGTASFGPDGRREHALSEPPVPAPLAKLEGVAGNAATGTAVPEATLADRPRFGQAARRQSRTPQKSPGPDSQVSPEEESLGAAGARALVTLGGEDRDDRAALAPAASSHTLVVHCEVTADGQSLQAFQQVLQAADIAWSESDAAQLDRLLRKLASQFPQNAAEHLNFAADEEPGEHDIGPDAQGSLQEKEQRAQQEKQLLAEVPPAFEIWYVVAAPEQVAAALEAMAQQPDIFRNASVLPGGIGSVPLVEWQAAHADAGGGETDLPTVPLQDENQANREKMDGQNNRRRGAPLGSGKESAADKSPKAPDGDAQDAGQPPREEDVSAGESAPAALGDAGGQSTEGDADGLKSLAEGEPNSIAGGGLGGMPAGAGRQGGMGAGNVAKGYAVRWNMSSPDLAEVLQQLLARFVPLLRDASQGEAAVPQAPAAPLSEAPEEASRPESAGARERDAPSDPGDALEPAAPREDMPTGASTQRAEDSLQRKAASNEAAGSDGPSERLRATQGRRDRPGRAKKKPDRATGRETQQGRAAGEDQAPAEPAGEAAPALPLESGADAADRNTAAAASGPGEPDFQDQNGERAAYRQVLFVLRLVPAAPAAADGAD